MHQPRPSGQGDLGAPPTEQDRAAIERRVRQLTNLKNLSGVGSLRLGFALPDGGYAIAQDMGGILKTITLKAPKVSDEPQERVDAPAYVPMMFSGVINRGRVRAGGQEGIRITLSTTTRKRLAGYDNDRFSGVPKELELKRFVVELGPRFFELMPYPPPLDWVITQYDSLRPTWYSGAMAEVVQIVGGYGRQDIDKLPKDQYERARMSIPSRVQERMTREAGNVRLPGYLGVIPEDGQVRYDYKFNETNGVGFDSKGHPWLLRVSTAGVYAMPLPLIPITTTKAFKEYVTEKEDDELLWALERFGGLPSGESFPAHSEDFEAWRRAGAIVKVCDAGDFYQHAMYGSAVGWSFNSRGDAGFNTCYDFDEDTGVCTSFAYTLRLGLGAAEDNGRLPTDFDLDDPVDAQALTRYLAQIYERTSANTAKNAAIKYKIRRIPVAELVGRARSSAARFWIDEEIDYLDSLVLSPIAAHSGSVSRVGAGRIPWSMPGFKFPEPFEGGCISFEAPMKTRPGYEIKRADTIIAGYYLGDQLKVVKFFTDDRQPTLNVDAPDEDCMIVGSWDITITEGMTGLAGNYYTSDFDDREAVAETITKMHIVGNDLGYDTTPFFSYDAFFWRPGTIWRNRYFKHQTRTEKRFGYQRRVAVCLPYFNRNAVLHARKDIDSGKTVTQSTDLYFIRDPYSYRYWTHDNIWAWIGGVSGPQEPVPVYPKDGNPVWVVQENYSPSLCSDFADQGPWIPGLPADYTWLVHPDINRWDFNGGGGPPKVNETSNSTNEPASEEGEIGVSMLDSPLKLKRVPPETYFLKSPDEYVGVFYRGSTKVAAGECKYAVVSEEHPTMPDKAAFQGWCQIADSTAMHHFIGVINE